MQSKEIYKRFLIKLNKNDSNEGVNILKSHFVILFNTERLNWLKAKLDSDDDDLSEFSQDLLVTDMEFTTFKKLSDSVEFILPGNFYRHASSYSTVTKDKCVGKVYHIEKKPLGYTNVIADDYSKGSFDYEEVPFVIAEKKIKIFFYDFQIKKSYVSYYREPVAIDIEGYEKFDSFPSTNIDSDLSDQNVDEVLNRMVLEVNRQIENGEGFQYAKERVATEE